MWRSAICSTGGCDTFQSWCFAIKTTEGSVCVDVNQVMKCLFVRVEFWKCFTYDSNIVLLLVPFVYTCANQSSISLSPEPKNERSTCKSLEAINWKQLYLQADLSSKVQHMWSVCSLFYYHHCLSPWYASANHSSRLSQSCTSQCVPWRMWYISPLQIAVACITHWPVWFCILACRLEHSPPSQRSEYCLQQPAVTRVIPNSQGCFMLTWASCLSNRFFLLG